MKILFLCHRIPYPPNKGDKIRSFNELKYLSALHHVDLVCLADEAGDLQYATELEHYCKQVFVYPLNKIVAKIKGLCSLLCGGSISVGYFYQKKMQQTVDQLLQAHSYDAVFCFSSTMAEYVLQSSVKNISAELVMDFCDVDSDKWQQYADDAHFPFNYIYKLEKQRLLDYEIQVNIKFDHSIFVTQNEAELFKQLYPAATKLTVMQNGVDFSYFSPDGSFKKLPKETPVLVFTGAMDYHANVAGVQWFCQQAWGQIRQQIPACQFYIVGSNPTPAVQELADLPGVTVTGFVDDIRSYYALADVCVIPLHMARGVQNKALEAMAMGKAVVTTTKVAQGVGAQGEHLVIADEVTQFVHAVLTLLTNKSQCKQIAESGRQFILHNFDWQKNMTILDTVLAGGEQ